jgi:predicted MFS family arabinose efflux permease
VAAVLLSAFVIVEGRRRRRGRSVLVDFTLFSIGSFRYGNVAALIVSLGEFGLIFVIPLFLQSVLGYTAFETGVVLLALAGGAFVAGPSAAQLAQRIGPRLVVQAGMALEAVGILLLGLTLSPTTTGWALAPYLFLYGLGIGLATAQLTSVILVEVPSRQSGEASGIQSTSRQIGSALGVAILGTTLWVSLGEAGLGADPETFTTSVSRVSYLACAFVSLGFLASLRLPASPGVRAASQGSPVGRQA